MPQFGFGLRIDVAQCRAGWKRPRWRELIQPAESNAMPDISTDKVCYLIVKAREFDVKVDVEEPDPGGNPTDSDSSEILQDYADDPTLQEIKTFVDDLNEDEQIDLVALMWLGRGDFDTSEREDARTEAIRARDEHGHTAEYLLGAPLLGDYLEEALSQFGESCKDIQLNHL
jgi:hypothetical protein